MPLEHGLPASPHPVAERRQAGRALRQAAPRNAHALWHPSRGRADPVWTIENSARHRIASLLPIRYDRMRRSAIAYLRGSAAVMAADLADTPTSGLWVQASGDCHLANFGVFASPEGAPVFDLNDFDDTLPAPFEWDLKRLATSFAVEARCHGLSDKIARRLAVTVSRAYRLHMHTLARQDPLVAWRSRIDVEDILSGIEPAKVRERELQRLRNATDASRAGYVKLIEKRGGEWRIKEKPPLVRPFDDRTDDAHAWAARTAFAAYLSSLPEDRRALLDRYRLTDVAFKVVGVGSVGTFSAIGLFATPDDDTLLLQLREAQPSVLAPFAEPSRYRNQGERVVVGQRLMQAVSDIFLGWTDDRADDLHCYVRQVKDSRLASIGDELAEGVLPQHAALCGMTLARAHARSGDSAAIAGYLGASGVFDTAIGAFALAYADRTESDFRLFREAIERGNLPTEVPLTPCGRSAGAPGATA